jgi:hypothetical protein
MGGGEILNGLNGLKKSTPTVGVIPLNVNFNINNENQYYKIGTMCVEGVTNWRGDGEGKRLRYIDFI